MYNDPKQRYKTSYLMRVISPLSSPRWKTNMCDYIEASKTRCEVDKSLEGEDLASNFTVIQ